MELGSKRGSEQEREEDPKRPRVDFSNFRLTVQPPLEHYQFPDAPLTGQWIVKLHGFGSIFDPPLNQIEMLNTQPHRNRDPDFIYFLAFEDLPPTLSLNREIFDTVKQVLNDQSEYRIRDDDPEWRTDREATIYNDDLELEISYSEEEGDIKDYIHMIILTLKNAGTATQPDLKALWHYTQPPRQGRTVNMAAVRRKDLLGLH